MNKTTARLQYIKTTKDSLSHLFPQASVAMVLFWTSKADFGSSLWIRKLPKCFNKTVSSTVGSLKIKKRVKIKEKKKGLCESFYLVGAVLCCLSMGSPQPTSPKAGHNWDPDSWFTASPLLPKAEAWQIPLSPSLSGHICPSAQLPHSLEQARWPQDLLTPLWGREQARTCDATSSHRCGTAIRVKPAGEQSPSMGDPTQLPGGLLEGCL